VHIDEHIALGGANPNVSSAEKFLEESHRNTAESSAVVEAFRGKNRRADRDQAERKGR
jgi:hypothetical protein